MFLRTLLKIGDGISGSTKTPLLTIYKVISLSSSSSFRHHPFESWSSNLIAMSKAYILMYMLLVSHVLFTPENHETKLFGSNF
jgi:hypothetical protein